ncbi:MAG: hypothetical protein ACI8WB_000895 [Phenylobacterium sp.]|jgi:hypothetical protein
MLCIAFTTSWSSKPKLVASFLDVPVILNLPTELKVFFITLRLYVGVVELTLKIFPCEGYYNHLTAFRWSDQKKIKTQKIPIVYCFLTKLNVLALCPQTQESGTNKYPWPRTVIIRVDIDALSPNFLRKLATLVSIARSIPSYSMPRRVL